MQRFHVVAGSVGLLFWTSSVAAAPLEVGPGKTYAKPCAAFAAAAQGDTVEIDAAGNGTYDGDVCAIAASGLTIRGVNGRAHIDAAGQNAQGKAIWVVQGDGVTIENIELSGAAVPDHNGAGIRAEGKDLTIRSSYFHDNEEGILGGAGEVLVELSEFAREGNCIDPAGCAHNMYLSNSVTKFTLRYSYTHSVTDGHLVKSRAQSNYIIANRITGESGTDSYEIDLPNAGTSYVIGNLVEQGPNTGNPTMLTFGEEGASNAGKDLYVVNNTFVNDRSGGGTFVNVDGSVTTAAVVKNNVFFGPGTAVSQSSATLANNFTGDPMLKDRAGFDYHLLPGSPCIDAGVDPGQGAGFPLTPAEEYVHPAGFETRTTVGVIDIGAYEFGGGGGNRDGGSTATGGSSGSDGSIGSGGGVNAAGGAPSGGAGTASGGAGGGATGAGGSAANGNGGSGAAGAAGATSDAGVGAPASGDSGGCGCRTAQSPSGAPRFTTALLALSVLERRRRIRRKRP